ncbi:MAG TPA: FemAB family XrtA/PEP-CTERM system-associated protein [Vicinamibacterales bacterium]|nr:FemAB family XrtA/PEP-CTERM system-associated protein [Vicinamibacterales bacterium]
MRHESSPSATPEFPVSFESEPTVTTDVSPAEWDRYVSTRADATGYHLWRWRDVFQNALGHECLYYAARCNGRIVGVLPTVRIRSVLFGRALSSLPYVNYGGVLADTTDAGRALLSAISRTLQAEGLDYLVLRHRARQFAGLPARNHKVTMLLPLEPTAEAMWNALDRKVRNQVRKAEKSGVTIRTGGADLLDDFYRVFARNMRDLGTPVYGRALFVEMLRAFPDAAHVHLAMRNDEAIAGAISYRYGTTIEVPSASSLREHRAFCPNHLLYWEVIRSAIAAGLTTLDFGRSTPNDGTYHFKEQWGARCEPLWWEYVLSAGAVVPGIDRHDSKFRLSIEAWKRLPVGIATLIGPRLARAVP